MTETKLRCAAHNEETLLRCGRCEAPICPRCTVMGPAGARCRECARHRTPLNHILTRQQLAAGSGAALALSTTGWCLLSWALDVGAFGLFWLGILLGGAVGHAAFLAAGRKRGRLLEIAAASASIAGLVLGLWLGSVLHAQGSIELTDNAVALVIGGATCLFAAVSRIRFL